MTQPSHPSSSLVDFVPLMRSPATWVPPPVTLPPGIHPLPDEIAAYFVYPYTLEDFVTQPQPPHEAHATRIAKLRESHDARVKFLKERELDKTKKRKDALRKLAPSYEPPDSGDEGSDGGGNTGMATLSPDGNASAKRKSGILEPTRRSTQTLLPSDSSTHASSSHQDTTIPEPSTAHRRDVMDDLVEGLAKLDQDQATW